MLSSNKAIARAILESGESSESHLVTQQPQTSLEDVISLGTHNPTISKMEQDGNFNLQPAPLR
ncbi:hypothetical protein ACRE_075050 [Hapsidospora chrysogenum ATCC 11550]|uniref:Uncharacterized protein n=1 Tax=Hapsidospora chrysogenum (strain ATCC 11550 / CBS 779.69 / DSM 880 / IAM 14645 / JCM 23072 / IMI 49137) TaxID=857340 RepID=A0A086SXD2_HAPC1|nr:hypothetical protein ACRE_075050 [Hapsidospora chrysogenum ATCC 11550]